MEEDKRSFKSLEDFNENIIENKPWAKSFLKKAQDVTKKCVLNWFSILNKIGYADQKNEEYVDIFISNLENLYEDLIFDVDTLYEKMLDKITLLLQNIEKYCIDLQKEMPEVRYEDVSLNNLYNSLKLKHSEYAALVEVRTKELEKMTKKQNDLCKTLGRNQVEFVSNSPLLSEKKLDELQKYIEELECERMDREERFLQLRDEIVNIMEELKISPESEFEKQIFSLSNTNVMISDSNMEQLDSLHERLVKESKNVKDELLELRNSVDSLWKKLEIDIRDRDAFCAQHTGNTIATLNAFRVEKARCDNLKIANIKIFIEKNRVELVALWEACQRNKAEEVEKFGLFNSSCFNEDLLELYEREIHKWTKFYNENSALLKNLEDYKTLVQEFNNLEAKQSSADRYKNRGGQLLAEEKRRNTIKNRLPKVEKKLFDLAEAYQNQHGVPFYVFGATIHEYVENLIEDYRRDRKLKLSARKIEREQQMVTRSNLHSPLPSSSRALFFGTPSRINSNTKRKITTPATENSKRFKVGIAGKCAASAGPKLSVNKVRRLSKKKRRESRRLSQLMKSTNESKSSDKENPNKEYIKFENELSTNAFCSRSTEIGVKNLPTIHVEHYK